MTLCRQLSASVEATKSAAHEIDERMALLSWDVAQSSSKVLTNYLSAVNILEKFAGPDLQVKETEYLQGPVETK